MGKKTSNPVEIINPDTGEISRGMIFWGEERPNKLIGGFFVGFQEAFKVLACDSDITPQAHKVLLYLLSELDFENFIHIKQKDIGEALKISPSNMSKAMAILKRKNILLLAPYRGIRCYKLNHFYGWKGSVTALNKQDKPSHLTVVR